MIINEQTEQKMTHFTNPSFSLPAKPRKIDGYANVFRIRVQMEVFRELVRA